MAKVRAYKIAEELGLDRNDLVAKSAEVGFDLRSPMTALDDAEAEELRRKLGGGSGAATEEKRVGRSIIRRRKRAPAKPPEPEVSAEAEPEIPAEPAPSAEFPAVAAELEAPAVIEVPEALEVPEAAEPAEEPPSEPAAEPLEERPPLAASGEARESPTPGEIRPGAAPAGPTRRPAEFPDTAAVSTKRPVRRTAIQGMNLKEQETLARQMRGNVQTQLERRRQLVEQQSRIRSRRRQPVGGKRKAVPARDREKALRVTRPLSFPELSGELGIKVHELLRRARGLGATVEREDQLDIETIELIAADVGFEVKLDVESVEDRVAAQPEASEEDLEPRPPVVTVMGHVDHGKTSLLDSIRKSNVVADEAGGITQHIGAYQADTPAGPITFLDTPGHAAFTQMRARGAQVTDIAILVVAADDGIMPQTVEAIDHARAAGVPIIVAVNKIDRPDADPQRVKQALLEHELVPEDFGGDTICVEVSATQGTNIEKLLEMVGLQAEVLELKARRTGRALGTVIEAELNRGRGPLASVLLREGTLSRGDMIVIGTTYGRVRSLVNERGETLKEAGPATPAQIVGLSEVPEAGDEMVVVKNEREAKALAAHRVEGQKRSAMTAESEVAPVEAEELFAKLGDTDQRELRVVLKADVRGTAEAIGEALEKLSTERVNLRVIHRGVGAISESDVMLASASSAILVGFHVRPESVARKAAEREGTELRTYEIVYDVLDDATQLMSGLLPPKVVERVQGHAEVRRLFQIPRQGTIAGCYVPEGVIQRNNQVRVVRDGVTIYTSRIASLRRFKDDVREVQTNFECGIQVENFNDVKVGDIIEAFVAEETPDTL
jgi:translation initiation factor IF-2